MPQFLRRLGIRPSLPPESPAEPSDGYIQVHESEPLQQSPTTIAHPPLDQTCRNLQSNKRRTRAFTGHRTGGIWSFFGRETREIPLLDGSLPPWTLSSGVVCRASPHLLPPSLEYNLASWSQPSTPLLTSSPPTPTEELSLLHRFHTHHITAIGPSTDERASSPATDTFTECAASQESEYPTCDGYIDGLATHQTYRLPDDLDSSQDLTSNPSDDCRQLLESHLWPQPLKTHNHHQEVSQCASLCCDVSNYCAHQI